MKDEKFKHKVLNDFLVSIGTETEILRELMNRGANDPEVMAFWDEPEGRVLMSVIDATLEEAAKTAESRCGDPCGWCEVCLAAKQIRVMKEPEG
jgi:predicted nuclease of predicted toxin-antitoxin system